MNFPGIVLLIIVFDLINSYLSRCKALWSLTAFEVNVLSLAMVTIETPGLKPKRLFILDKNFHVKTTQMPLQSQFCNKRNFQPITSTNIRSKVAFKRCLRRFPSSSQIIQCLSKETPPGVNERSLMKMLQEKNVFNKEILPASRNVKPSIA